MLNLAERHPFKFVEHRVNRMILERHNLVLLLYLLLLIIGAVLFSAELCTLILVDLMIEGKRAKLSHHNFLDKHLILVWVRLTKKLLH